MILRTIDIEVLDRRFCLFYNNDASFAIQDRFGNLDDLKERTGCESREKVQATLEVFQILAAEGEAAKRYCGYDAGEQPGISSEDAAFLTPGDVRHMEAAIYAAIVMALDRKVPSLDDVDLGLLELEKKRSTQTQG